MSNQKELQEKSSSWLAHIKETTALSQQGTFEVSDELEAKIIVEWALTDITSPKLATFKKNICEMACDILAPTETEFLRKNPQAASQEVFLSSCAPLFEKDIQAVDWKTVEETIKSTIKQFYTMDLSKFGAEVIKPLLDDIYFLATAKDQKTKKVIGFLMASITPALPYGNVKIITLISAPTEEDRGLKKILLDSILKVIPDIKRLFLFVRPTNNADLEAYQAMGFAKDKNLIQDPNHKINTDYQIPLEYKTEGSEL